MIRGSIHPLVVSLLVLIASVGAAGQMPAQTAPSEHSSMVTFHWNTHQPTAPMKVVRVMLGDKQIANDVPVSVEGMWMRNISVTLANVSAKTIVVCGVNVLFPETIHATSGPVPSVTMRVGNYPQHVYMQRDGTIRKPNNPQPEFHVAPGSSVTFHAPDGADLEQAEAYKLVDPITKVNIYLDEIFFSNESRWTASKYYIALPPPTLWQEVSPEEFVANTPAAQR